jgi:hypothetical protein
VAQHQDLRVLSRVVHLVDTDKLEDASDKAAVNGPVRHDQGPLTTSRAAFQFQACMHTACAADPGEHENAVRVGGGWLHDRADVAGMGPDAGRGPVRGAQSRFSSS